MILVDTHVLVWMALDPAKLSKKARKAIADARTGSSIAISAISLWELAWLVQNGRIQVSGTMESFFRECTSRVTILPITADIAAHAVQLPPNYPKDPQDRLIGSTARIEGIPLVTADENIRRSHTVQTIW